MISALEGRLSRTWIYNHGQKHNICLYHDTITGKRVLTVNFEELSGTEGTSSLLMSAEGHKLSFNVDGNPGYVLIQKESWKGFRYLCFVNNERLFESTETIETAQESLWSISIEDFVLCRDEPDVSDYKIAWYNVKATRIRDNISTTVHRRFQEFAELFSQIKQALKGHQLYRELPKFPEKTLKILGNSHESEQFLQNRKAQLQSFLNFLLAIPHVGSMTCVCSFLGIMDFVREFSVVFNNPTLGLTFTSPEKLGRNNPAVVGSIQRPELCEGILIGDMLTRTNGLTVYDQTLGTLNNRMKLLPRPLILHFVQALSPVFRKNNTTTSDIATLNNEVDQYDVPQMPPPPPPPPIDENTL